MINSPPKGSMKEDGKVHELMNLDWCTEDLPEMLYNVNYWRKSIS